MHAVSISLGFPWQPSVPAWSNADTHHRQACTFVIKRPEILLLISFLHQLVRHPCVHATAQRVPRARGTSGTKVQQWDLRVDRKFDTVLAAILSCASRPQQLLSYSLYIL
jgi:hypothetical protein